MAVLALTAATIYAHGYDLSGDTNKLSIKSSVDDLDVTTFGSGGAKARIGGLRDVEAQFDGFWQAGTGTVGEELFPDLGTANRVVTVSPTGTEATTAYLFQAGKFSVEEFAEVGAVAPFSLSCMGSSSQGIVRGQLVKAKGTVSATGATGTVSQVGAVSASQFVYASLHVFSAGTTITVQVQSAPASNFASPTTRATFTGITTAGGTWATRAAGAITDTWWRFNVSAITGTFSVAGAIGIG
jgi:hypothetical protein